MLRSSRWSVPPPGFLTEVLCCCLICSQSQGLTQYKFSLIIYFCTNENACTLRKRQPLGKQYTSECACKRYWFLHLAILTCAPCHEDICGVVSLTLQLL
jgi:hypothetical protein